LGGSKVIVQVPASHAAAGRPRHTLCVLHGQPRNDRIMAECLNCQILSKPAQSDVIVNTLTGLMKVRQ
jgi:hypothetical protein